MVAGCPLFKQLPRLRIPLTRGRPNAGPATYPDHGAPGWFVEFPRETLALAGALAGVMPDGGNDRMILLAADFSGLPRDGRRVSRSPHRTARELSDTGMDLQLSRALGRMASA